MSTARRSTQQTLELLYLLVRKELKARYKSSFLGYLWALANPFAYAFVYWIAFKFIMRVDVENYSLFLITGIFPWLWLSMSVVSGTRSLFVNATLVKKVDVPRAILPLSNVAQEMVHFAFALPVIIAFLCFAGDYPLRASWLWQVPLMLALQFAFTYPIVLALSVLNIFVHDIEHLVGIGFTLLFFATPMVYPITLVPEAYRHYFEWNPFYALMQSWRTVFLDASLDGSLIGYAAAFAALAGVLAWLIYHRLGPRIGELV